MMTSFPRFRVFLVLLTILSTEACCGQSGDCPYRYCSHLATLVCSSGGFVSLRCVVYNATGPIQVRWYHSQNGNPADAEELNITTGRRYTVEESEQSPSSSRYENCTEGDQLYRYELKFNYSEGDSGSYWCRIVIGGDTLLELSEAWKVLSATGGPATCGLDSQTDAKCAGQSTPILASTTLFVQSTPTSVVGATSESVNTVTHDPVQMHSPVQTPSASSTSSTLFSDDCTLGGVSCFVYLGAGLGALVVIVVIVVLLVVVVIVLVYISIKIRKKKRKGEREYILTLILLVGGTVYVLVCIKLYLQEIATPSSHEHQLEDEYCLPEEVQKRRDESNTGTYQDLNLDTMDYTSMYSKVQDSYRQQTPTVARGGHVYAVVDSTTVEPPSQYAKLQ